MENQQHSATKDSTPNDSDPQSKVSPPRPQSSLKKDKPFGKPAMKSQNLKRAGDNISELLSKFKGMKSDKKAEASSKKMYTNTKDKLVQAKMLETNEKRLESHSRKIYQDKQNTLADITLLK